MPEILVPSSGDKLSQTSRTLQRILADPNILLFITNVIFVITGANQFLVIINIVAHFWASSQFEFISLLFFQLDTSGNTTLTQKVQTIKEVQGIIWFPEKSRLQVQVEVIERATGSKESVVDNSCLFTSSPYVVEFRNTPNYFKPGFPFRAKV